MGFRGGRRLGLEVFSLCESWNFTPVDESTLDYVPFVFAFKLNIKKFPADSRLEFVFSPFFTSCTSAHTRSRL